VVKLTANHSSPPPARLRRPCPSAPSTAGCRGCRAKSCRPARHRARGHAGRLLEKLERSQAGPASRARGRRSPLLDPPPAAAAPRSPWPGASVWRLLASVSSVARPSILPTSRSWADSVACSKGSGLLPTRSRASAFLPARSTSLHARFRFLLFVRFEGGAGSALVGTAGLGRSPIQVGNRCSLVSKRFR
jgi:hypothetical protein